MLGVPPLWSLKRGLKSLQEVEERIQFLNAERIPQNLLLGLEDGFRLAEHVCARGGEGEIDGLPVSGSLVAMHQFATLQPDDDAVHCLRCDGSNLGQPRHVHVRVTIDVE
jgi:hypothetical protein